MATYQVNILNPKAVRLLKDLADLKLISISETTADSFQSAVERIRSSVGKGVPTLEEITKEVEAVRAERYARKKEKGNN